MQVSTIIPAHNAEKFLREAIDSALCQKRVSQEIIVVDDGSIDSTPQILKEYVDQIICITNTQPLGPAAARNIGAQIATGQWLAFLDADDKWESDKLERQLALGATKTVNLVYTNRLNFGDLSRVGRFQSDSVTLYEGDIFDKLIMGNFITTSSVIIKREIFYELNGFANGVIEDWDLWLRYSEKGESVGLCKEPLTQYRIHPCQISKDQDKRIEEARLVLKRAFSSPRGQKLSPRLKRKAYGNIWAVAGFEYSYSNPRKAIICYLRALMYWPLNVYNYKEIIKILIRSSLIENRV